MQKKYHKNSASLLCIARSQIAIKKNGRVIPEQECGMIMGKQKKTRKYATMKRMLSLRDQRLKEKDRLKPKKKEKKDPSALEKREVPQYSSCLFLQYNTQLGPPYHILVDTNFINFPIKAKLDLVQSMMDCVYAKCIPCITDCVMSEIEKLGQKYQVALRIAKDPRSE